MRTGTIKNCLQIFILLLFLSLAGCSGSNNNSSAPGDKDTAAVKETNANPGDSMQSDGMQKEIEDQDNE